MMGLTPEMGVRAEEVMLNRGESGLDASKDVHTGKVKVVKALDAMPGCILQSQRVTPLHELTQLLGLEVDQ